VHAVACREIVLAINRLPEREARDHILLELDPRRPTVAALVCIVAEVAAIIIAASLYWLWR
jgi:hypothetical protein